MPARTVHTKYVRWRTQPSFGDFVDFAGGFLETTAGAVVVVAGAEVVAGAVVVATGAVVVTPGVVVVVVAAATVNDRDEPGIVQVYVPGGNGCIPDVTGHGPTYCSVGGHLNGTVRFTPGPVSVRT